MYELMEPFHLPCSEPADDEYEPECECRFAGDQADASDCELHNGNSQWNVSQRRIAAEIERFGETHRLTKEMNAWMDAYYERPEVA